ncbi:hypothetical protein FA743_09620 [Paracoccus gahaiensis]|uniref:Uncharacterized protein n=1 Tax=Paracoccus gahaiensis TaxID=1706839 RepID=A0A4U0R984_9RHOB|nr:hypothetical protein [Paracoccus gahaiensis]TJZ91731.1 hypothetical protein FA743_09620 [Paracoccus gahaiensis]
MANRSLTTPFGVTEPASRHFTHTPISRAFSGLLAGLAAHVEAERDISAADGRDPSFAASLCEAEAARAGVLALIDRVRCAAVMRPEDRPLRHMALICYLLMQAGTNAEFCEARQVLDQAPGLFACPGHGAVAWRCRQMLRSMRMRVGEMASLPCHVDPHEIEPEMAAVNQPVPA